jgi:membrane protein DedA with SNARE-associated domain
MTSIRALFEEHGLTAVFLGVLVEQLGAPVPALPLLLLAGARAAIDEVFGWQALALASAASAIADTSWFLAGRRYGKPVLGLLCRASLSPESCIERAELSFSRQAVLTVLLAKFIPGVSTLAPPLAGALRMPLATFLLVDLAGTLLWVTSAMALGWLLQDQLEQVARTLLDTGGKTLIVLLVALALYITWRLLRLHGSGRIRRPGDHRPLGRKPTD